MKITSISGNKINETQIKELYNLRLNILPLKATVNPDSDYAYFSNYAKASQKIFVFQNPQKEAKGFYFCKYELVKLPTETFIRFAPEYGIIDKSYRGQANNFFPIVKMILFLTLRYPFYPIYFVGTAYPSSYIALRKHLSIVIDSAQSLSAKQEAAFMNYAESINCTLHKTSYIYTNPTIPEFSEEVVARYEKSPYYAYYNSLNPNWREGKSLVVVCPVRKTDVVKRVFRAILGLKNK